MSRTQILMAFAGNLTGAAIVAAFIKPLAALLLVGVAAVLVAAAIVEYRR